MSSVRKRNGSRKTSTEEKGRDSSYSDVDRESDLDQVEDAGQDTPKPREPISAKKVITRTITACVLTGLYMSLLYTGHLYIIIVMMLVQTGCYRELVNIRYVEAKERNTPWFRTLQYAWFFVPMMYIHGETFHKFCIEHKSLFYLTAVTRNFASFLYICYCILLMFSVLSLRKGKIRFQISQYLWSIVAACVIVLHCKFFATNILSGIFWFWFPMATVVMNDVSAYFVGISCGRKFINKPFLQLSPNKTWEGFIGASILTMIFSFFFPALLAPHAWFVCPAEGLYFTIPPALSCIPNPVFLLAEYNVPFLGPTLLYPIQFHGVWFGLFASFVAPFGGFFASAIKRAYNKKDFDSFFPGHGGLMDRMDCQFLILSFTSFYCYTFIQSRVTSINKLLYLASTLTIENQQFFLEELKKQIETMAAEALM